MSQTVTDTSDKVGEKGKKTSKVVTSNRRDIPTASFDFTNGAFAKSRRTRLISIVILGLTILALIFTIYRTMGNFSAVASNNSRAKQLKDTGDTIISEYSTFSGKGTDTMSLVNKYNSATSALTTVTSEQADIEKFFTEILSYSGPELVVSSMEYNPKASDGTFKRQQASVKVSISANGRSIGAVLEFITKVTSMELLTNVTANRSGQSVQMSGDVLVNNPPDRLLEKLSELGIRYNKDVQATTPVEGADPDTAPTAVP